MVQLVAELQ